jgi:multiple sugar transport system permease protein/N,N'-diacetylchitobiose transport system permease protein
VSTHGSAAVPQPRRRPLSLRLAPAALLAPAVILVLIALGYPMLRQVVMSFQEFGLAQQFGQPPTWVGLDNYGAILTDPYFWSVFAKSVAFCFWTAGWTMFGAIGIALLMRSASAAARTLMNISLVVVWAMPLIASLTVWQWLVDANFGLLNHLLTGIGLDGFAGFSWLAANPWTFYLIASAVIVWASMPLATITIYSALTQVDDALLEAAQLDGAGYLGRLRNVVFPTIMPVVSLIGVLQVIWDLRVFTHIHVLQQSGGITQQTNLLGTYVYQVGISQGDYGTASALAMIILLLTLVMTAKYLQMLWKQGDLR